MSKARIPRTTRDEGTEQDKGRCAPAPGSGVSAEYRRGVSDACAWLEKQTITDDERKGGVSWSADCPQSFAWTIRTHLLPPNDKLRHGAKTPEHEH
jgi:hypothetical protein